MMTVYDPKISHNETPQTQHTIHVIQPAEVRKALYDIVQQHGDADKHMSLTINGFFKTRTYRATDDKIVHLMEEYRLIRNYREILVDRLELTLIKHKQPSG